MKFQICVGVLFIASNCLLASGEYTFKKLGNVTDDEKTGLVNAILITPKKNISVNTDELGKLATAVSEGIEKVAQSILEEKGSTTVAQTATTVGQTAAVQAAAAAAGEAVTAAAGEAVTATAGEAVTATAGEAVTATAGEAVTATAGEAVTTTAGEAVTATAGEAVTTAAGETVTTVAGQTGSTATVQTQTTEGQLKLVTTFVQETLVLWDYSQPINFFVTNTKDKKTIPASDFLSRLDELKENIEKRIKPFEATVAIVGQGLAAWAIVLIVIAVLLVVGGAGYFLLSYFRKQRGNSF